MKNFKNKKMLLVLISIALLLTITVSSTLAFLTDRTESVTNTFTPTSADITVTDTVENNVKSNVVIQNGPVRAFVRAKVVANWMVGDKIVAPWTDDISYNSTWEKGENDDFYYFPTAVEPGAEVTPTLFESYVAERPANVPENAKLIMDIIVQAVQAEGMTGVTTPQQAFAELAK